MGLLENIAASKQKDDKLAADNALEGARQYLRKQNGLTHAICFYLYSEVAFRGYTTCDGRLSDQLNQIIVGMQKDGYEILDVKMVPTFENDALTKSRNGYLATITYK